MRAAGGHPTGRAKVGGGGVGSDERLLLRSGGASRGGREPTPRLQIDQTPSQGRRQRVARGARGPVADHTPRVWGGQVTGTHRGGESSPKI